jgi:hypothetical protein
VTVVVSWSPAASVTCRPTVYVPAAVEGGHVRVVVDGVCPIGGVIREARMAARGQLGEISNAEGNRLA